MISLNLKGCQGKGQKLAKIWTLGRVYLRTILRYDAEKGQLMEGVKSSTRQAWDPEP